MTVHKHVQQEPEQSPLVFYLFLGVLGLAAVGAVVYMIFS